MEDDHLERKDKCHKCCYMSAPPVANSQRLSRRRLTVTISGELSPDLILEEWAVMWWVVSPAHPSRIPRYKQLSSQSEASIQVTWLVLANERPPSSTPRPQFPSQWLLLRLVTDICTRGLTTVTIITHQPPGAWWHLILAEKPPMSVVTLHCWPVQSWPPLSWAQ